MITNLLHLFFTFFKIGLFTIGGGYAMLPVMKSEALLNGWLTEEEIINFLAISESTPGPFAINMATFVGASQYGVLGAVVTTIGVVLPSFIIILLIYKVYAKYITNKYIISLMKGLRATVIGLILATSLSLIFDELFKGGFNLSLFDIKALVITLILAIVIFLKRKLNPILFIGISAVLGIFFYGFLN